MVLVKIYLLCIESVDGHYKEVRILTALSCLIRLIILTIMASLAVE
jgi:hypothetical protein